MPRSSGQKLKLLVDSVQSSKFITQRKDGAYYVVSPQFFAWLCGFGPDAQIVAPESAVAQMRAHVEAIAALYR